MRKMRIATIALAAFVASMPLARRAAAQPVPGGDVPPPPPPPEDESDVPPEAEQTAPPPPAAAGPPAQPPDMNAFRRDLSPYGRWVQTPEYGVVWVPNGVGPEWQPYTDGTWVETAWGWSFVPAVPWGAVVFHYGRWGFRAGLGWFWVPGTVWAPAWVSWRYYNGYVCWSPYGPPGYVYPARWRGWVVVPSYALTLRIRTHVVPWRTAVRVVRWARPAPSVVGVPRRGAFYGPPREFVRVERSRARVVRVRPHEREHGHRR
jgi:hypothetical protein